MRIPLGIIASAAVVFLAGAVGLLGSWAVGGGAALLLVGAVAAAVAMEERDPLFAPMPAPARSRH
ncbi:MAG: hypothetical protein ACSLFP_11380 [Acidimicrobiales bacterium]